MHCIKTLFNCQTKKKRQPDGHPVLVEPSHALVHPEPGRRLHLLVVVVVVVEPTGLDVVAVVEVGHLLLQHLLLLLVQLVPPALVVRLHHLLLRHTLHHLPILPPSLLLVERHEPIPSQRFDCNWSF